MVLIRRVIAKVQQLLVCKRERKRKSGVVHARSGVKIYNVGMGK